MACCWGGAGFTNPDLASARLTVAYRFGNFDSPSTAGRCGYYGIAFIEPIGPVNKPLTIYTRAFRRPLSRMSCESNDTYKLLLQDVFQRPLKR